MRTLRLVLWVAVGLALFAAGALTVGWFGPRGAATVQAGAGSVMAPGGPLGGAFTLVDHKGGTVTEAVFRDKPSAVLFGYTHCPDICPTTLMEMSSWADALEADADKLRFVFMTVDPERDTPEVMNEYVSAFSDKVIGITGEPRAVRDVLHDYKIPFSKVPLAGSAYSMDHLASVVLLDEKGSFVGTIAREENRDVAIAKLKKLVAG